MEKKEKTSPLHGTNIFDPATLLGASPFSPGLSALPFAHVSPLSPAFSMLGHPAFPVTSLFGHLGDGLTSPLGIPLSLASSLSPTSAKFNPFSSSSSAAALSSSLFSLSKHASSSQSKSYTDTTHTATTTSSSSTSALSSGRGRRGRGGQRGGNSRGRGGRRSLKDSGIPLSLMQSSALLSPSMLEKFARQQSNGSLGLDGDIFSDKSRGSSLFDLSIGKDSSKTAQLNSPKSNSHHWGLPGALESPHKTSTNDGMDGHSSLDKVHIDSLKKKLIADQIRQRVQSKVESPHSPGPGRRRGRGRGRPPKISSEPELSPKELEEQARIQARIKRELELELRQQQAALLMMKSHAGSSSSSSAGHKAKRSPDKKVEKNAEKTEKDSSPERDPLPLDLGKKRTMSTDSAKDDQSTSHTSVDDSAATSDSMKSSVDSTSGTGSSMDDDDDEEEETGDSSESDDDSDSEMNGSSQEGTEQDGESSESSKRKAEDDDDDDDEEVKRPVKRRHVVLDDTKIKIPLEKGWKRQTNIHTYGRRGIVGEVWYFAPCGRKMKTIPDVMRYLERHPVMGLGRDNFSFNTKVNVGEFYEARVGGGENGFVKLSDSEIEDRLFVTVSRRMKKIENQKKREKLKMQQILARQMIENKMKQKLEQQELARKVAEMQFQKRIEREQQKEMLRRAKEMKMMEKKKQRDQIRVMREQERIQRDEQIRMKREMRAQQMLEKQRRKQEVIQQKKRIAAIRKAEEREMKIQQANLIKEQIRMKQEQERRRQHMVLIKALEQRKRHEEREKQKRIIREKREEQRRLEFLLAQELKKPVEDMELLNHRDLPEFPRIPGTLVDGECFADCLMCMEFLHNFAKSLGFDRNSLPTLKGVQDAILCKTEEDGEEYISLVTHLLRYALDDPGVPNPKEAVTKLGQRIVDMDISEAIVSEVLRVFMVVRNGSENELSEYLKNFPVEACSVKQRAEILVFLCNELNCSKSIVAEIDNHLEKMGDMRRDKWIIEGRLRRLRTLRVKKFHRDISKMMMTNAENEDSTMTTISKQTSDDEDSNDSLSLVEEDSDEEPATLEECDKQLDKLQKQQNSQKAKSFASANHVRAIDLGQDRFKRRYWVLPNCRGVYIEGMGSGEELFQSKVLAKCEKADSKNIKIEVIDERTEKKGLTVLEEVEEKKGIEILGESEEKKGIVVKKEGDGGKSAEIKTESNESVKCENSESVKCVKTELDKEPEKLNEAKHECVSEEEEDTGEVGEEVTGAAEEGGCEPREEDTEKHITEDNHDHTHKVVEDNNSAAESMDTSDKPLVESDQDKPQSISNSGDDSSSKPHSKHVELKIPKVNSSAIETSRGSSLGTSNPILQVPQSTNLNDFCSRSIDNAIKSENQETAGQDPKPSTSLPNTSNPTMGMFANFMSPPSSSTSLGSMPFSMFPPPAHSGKHTIDHKPSFMSIDSILENKPTSSQNTNFFANMYSMGLMGSLAPVNMANMANMNAGMNQVNDNKPWFSIVPRVPCDDMSLTRGNSKSLPSVMPPSFMTHMSQMSQISQMSQMPFQPFPMQSVTSLSSSSFQPIPSSGASSTEDQSLPTTPGPVSEESFKKPDTPSSTSAQALEHEDMLKNIQGEERPVPEEMKKGWWRIIDSEMFQGLLNNLHQRGLREKNLHKTITKFYNHALASANNPNLELTNLLSSGEEESSEEEVEEEEVKVEEKKEEEPKGKGKKGKGRGKKAVGRKKKGGKKAQEEEEKEEEKEQMDTAETEEAAEDQTKEEEKDENKTDESKVDNKDKVEKEESEKKDTEKESTEECKEDSADKKKKYKEVITPQIDTKSKIDEADRQALDDVEALEERVSSASLQIKGWKLAPKTYADESEVNIIPRGETKKTKEDMYPLEMAKERLLQLESNIERRYLKPPLSKAQRINLNSISSECVEEPEYEPDFKSLPPGLQTWRIAVATATSPAQLTLCITQLTMSISWEKSIMKVLCQICRKDDNEAELLLCDGCDRGYHTYCFKPKLESVPDGDWYCFECVGKAAGETCCLVCGRHLGKMAECQSCSRCVHIDCLDPPLPRVPRKWFCASCEEGKGPNRKRVRKNSTASSSTPSTPVPPLTPTQPLPTPPPQPDLTPTGRKRRSDFGVPRKRKTSEGQECESPQKKDSKSSSPSPKNEDKDKQNEKEKIRISEQSTDLKICKVILTEMMKHEDGWPFLQPVNCKHFPSYRKYIKSPMDFGTMKVKLRDHVYTKRCEFVSEAHLVFDNCKLFNEDDSEVGQCGHNMKKYFVKRWKELILEAILEESKS